MNVLILAPHTDDGELGCGGTIVRLIREGHTVYYAAFSVCEESVPKGFPKNALETEVKLATRKLGIKKKNLIIYRFPVRKFNEHRQAILEEIIVLKNKIKPELVFMPSSFSIHQDHQIIYQEGIRALKHNNCLGYDLPWDTLKFATDHFYKLTRNDVEIKWQALRFYKTQRWRFYLNKEFIYGLARVRGAQIAHLYAESFETIRSIY
jgi:LmbE family N-acetylglucosaminyl deacetylase